MEPDSPALLAHVWSEKGEPPRFMQRSPKTPLIPTPSPATDCFCPEFEETWLRFVEGRSVRAITTRFLEWCLEKLVGLCERLWVLVWDNTSWHTSAETRTWIKEHNRKIQEGRCSERDEHRVLF